MAGNCLRLFRARGTLVRHFSADLVVLAPLNFSEKASLDMCLKKWDLSPSRGLFAGDSSPKLSLGARVLELFETLHTTSETSATSFLEV